MKKKTTLGVFLAIFMSSMLFFYPASGYVYAEENYDSDYTIPQNCNDEDSDTDELSYEEKLEKYGHYAGISLREDENSTNDDDYGNNSEIDSQEEESSTDEVNYDEYKIAQDCHYLGISDIKEHYRDYKQLRQLVYAGIRSSIVAWLHR